MNTLNEQVLNLLATVKKSQETMEAYLRDQAEQRQLRYQTFIVGRSTVDVGNNSTASEAIDLSLFDSIRVWARGVGSAGYRISMIISTQVGKGICYPEVDTAIALHYSIIAGTASSCDDVSVCSHFDAPFGNCRFALHDQSSQLFTPLPANCVFVVYAYKK